MIKKEADFTRKSQFSIEYLFMMGFTLLLLIPTVILFATESENIKADIAASHATQVARKIADKAEEIYYQGAPSRTTIKVNLPRGVESITFQNKEIVVYFRTPENIVQEIVQVTPVNITGSITPSQGIHYIEIRSEGEFVSVTES